MPTPEERARALVDEHGRTLAQEAGIDLRDESGPLWQLLVLTLLLSKRIGAGAALASARELWAAGWFTPDDLRRSTWNQRVAALGRGGYRRYDFSTATRLEEAAAMVRDRWGDDLRGLLQGAEGDPRRIARLLQEFGGIGPTGASIFLREVQAVWPQVRPYVDDLTRKGARLAELPTDVDDLAALVPSEEFAALAAALVRVARDKSLQVGPSAEA